ncbi:MAG: ABC transporter ATP-binding protein [Spirochaetaceae bacterium]|jgi:peptide/nickel transport system ATP-binding protein|nr:ABC transporter ATP-binding protein [Spirochaetaceae bacterium]
MSDYIDSKEAKRILKENRKAIKALEQRRRVEAAQSKPVRMAEPDNILEFDDLHTWFYTDVGIVKAVDGVSFSIPKGKTVGVVGESGCGKSVTSLSAMRLLAQPQGQIVSGEIRFALPAPLQPVNIAALSDIEMRRIRGNNIAMIFQDPMTSLNPVLRIGFQLDEVIKFHKEDLQQKGIVTDFSKEGIRQRSIEMIETVGIPNAERIYESYPFELSGGMVQRIMIAMALQAAPSLIIADEPTTALDVTIQAQILDLLRELKSKINASIMLITHDLGVVAEMADYVVVMYSGRIVEKGRAIDIFKNPAHPYTRGLMKSKPSLVVSTSSTAGKKERLYSIPGRVPNPVAMPDYCYFRDRCEFAGHECNGEYPVEHALSDTHRVACYRGHICKKI